MNILITNDDGWGFAGINVLESVARKYGDVWVVAPDKPMSGISHQLTFERPMSFIEKAPNSFSLDGTPADCVRVAMSQLDVEFDWVLSGINNGANLGCDIFISGTVAAAREASQFGCKAIALSQHLRAFNEPFDWQKTQAKAEHLIPILLKREIADGTWVNINFPDVDVAAESVEVVETSNDRLALPTKFKRLEDGRLLYHGVYKDRKRTPGFDTDTCFNGKISMTFHGG